MSAKHSNWNDVLLTMMAATVFFTGAAVTADDFQFFGKGIDYWNDVAPAPKSSISTAKKSEKALPSGDDAGISAGDRTKGAPSLGGAFPWHQYLDPKNKEFFKEGDYTPPEPFMEIVRDPSDANLKMWFEYISKKNELSGKLQSRMQEYLSKNSAGVPAEQQEKLISRVNALPKAAPASHRYRFRLYFDSQCPHCKRMLGTMAELQGRGYLVEAKQVDHNTDALAGISIPVEQASQSEIQTKDIQSVPVLLVGDLKRKVVYRMNGYQTTAQVLTALPKEDGP